MAEKKDFMSELAKSVEAEKHGGRPTMSGIDEFVSRHQETGTAASAAGDEEEGSEAVRQTVQQDTAEEPDSAAARTADETAAAADTGSEETAVPEEEVYEENGKPESFAEEERIKVEKPKKQLKPAAKVGIGIGAAALVFLIYWFGFAPKIVVPDFVGQDVSVVSTWATQNKMDAGVVAMAPEEYSLEYDEGIVMAQSVAAGTRVKQSTPITITVSAGPDPDEAIEFPDLNSMTLDEIRTWIDDNKLLKTKVTTQYSDSVAEGDVISYELRNISESEFTRGSTLNIVCSKGKEPAKTVQVVDYTGKTYTECLTWATNNKITLNKVEQLSDTVESGYIISQDKTTSDTLQAGDTMTVVVSTGKGITIPNLVGYTAEQLEAWQAGKDSSGVTVVTKSVYNAAPAGSVISQSIAAGTTVESGSVLELTISLYLPILETDTTEWIGVNYLKLKAWVDEANSKGASIQAGEYKTDDYDYSVRVYSDTVPADGIVKIGCLYGTSDLADGCGRPLNLNSRIAYQVSLGPEPTATVTLTSDDVASCQAIRNFCSANSGVSGFGCYFKDSTMSDTDPVSVVTSEGTYSTGEIFPAVSVSGTITIYPADTASESTAAATAEATAASTSD